jgi:integrase
MRSLAQPRQAENVMIAGYMRDETERTTMAGRKRKKPRQYGSGSIQWRDGRCYVRVSHTDPVTRKRSEIVRRADSEEHAKELLTRLLYESQETGGQSVQNAGKTFADLAARFERLHMVAAEYSERGGHLDKTDGLRPSTLKNTRSLLNTLRHALGTVALTDVTSNFLVEFRRQRIKAPAVCRRCLHDPEHAAKHPADEKPPKRSMTAVHRELMLLNQMLSVAVGDGWIRSNPFASFRRGKSLIQVRKYEKPRDRVMSADEEAAILSACPPGFEGRRCRLTIVALVDTGMRRGELFALRWSDIDLAGGRITVRAITNKTLKGRHVPLSARLRAELKAWGAIYPHDATEPLLGPTGNVKRTFAAAKAKAGVSDLRFHDLRHTAATRLEGAGMKESAVAKVLGHARIQQTQIYIKQDEAAIVAAAGAAVDATNAANAVETIN